MHFLSLPGVILSAVVVAGLGASACNPRLPNGVSCEGDVVTADNAAALSQALQAASPGDCVVLATGTYEGSFALPASISLVEGQDQTAVLRSTDEGPALSVAGSLAKPRTRIVGIEVADRAGHGILVDGGGAELSGIAVHDNAGIGVAIRCQRIECLRDEALVSLQGCALNANQSGLWISGASVDVQGCDLAQNRTNMVGGAGAWILGGATVRMSGVSARNNNLGIVVDNATASLDGISIEDNDERGLWAQHLSGSLGSPALHLRGGTVRGNRRAGIGIIQSAGVVVEDSEVAQTALAPVTIDEATVVDVGDGVGLFDRTAAVRLEGVVLRANARAQALVDRGGVDIVLRELSVAAGAQELLVVVQNTDEVVRVDPAVLSTPPAPLLLSDVALALPEP